MAAAAGKKDSVSLSLFLELNDFEVEDELSTLAIQACAEGTPNFERKELRTYKKERLNWL